jgi:hypothetical protein
MSDRALDNRVARILTKLQMVSDASSASIVSNDGGGSSKPESSPPPGARPDRDRDKPPPKDRSLFEWYAWQFARSRSEERTRLLCYLAERDHARLRSRSPSPRGRTGPEDEPAAMRRIVEWYEGVDALEVAVLEDVSVQHVHKARRVHKRVAIDGRRRPEWSDWSDDVREAAVARRRHTGASQHEVADDLGVSRRTVQRYWR